MDESLDDNIISVDFTGAWKSPCKVGPAVSQAPGHACVCGLPDGFSPSPHKCLCSTTLQVGETKISRKQTWSRPLGVSRLVGPISFPEVLLELHLKRLLW